MEYPEAVPYPYNVANDQNRPYLVRVIQWKRNDNLLINMLRRGRAKTSDSRAVDRLLTGIGLPKLLMTDAPVSLIKIHPRHHLRLQRSRGLLTYLP